MCLGKRGDRLHLLDRICLVASTASCHHACSQKENPPVMGLLRSDLDPKPFTPIRFRPQNAYSDPFLRVAAPSESDEPRGIGPGHPSRTDIPS